MAADTVAYRALTAAELPLAQLLSQQVTWPHRLEDWAFGWALGVIEGAFAGGQLLGVALRVHHGNCATLGMVIVSPAAQGRGIGSMLVRRALAAAPGTPMLLYATDEGRPVYLKHGFVDAGTVVQHQGMLSSPPPVGVRDGESITPVGADETAAVLALDAQATGMDRRALIDALLTAGDAALLRRNGEPVGYGMTRRFGRGALIGPVIAPDADAARTLIAHFMPRHAGAFTRVDVHGGEGLSPWLEAAGLERVGGGTLMVHGALPMRARSPRVFSVAAQALG